MPFQTGVDLLNEPLGEGAESELDRLRQRFGSYFGTEGSLLQGTLDAMRKENVQRGQLIRQQGRTEQRSINRQDAILEGAENERNLTGAQFGLGVVTDLLGGYFVDKAYEDELKSQQARFGREIAPIATRGQDITGELGGQIGAAMGSDPFEEVASGTLASGRASTTAAKAKAQLDPQGESILGAAADQYLAGEVNRARLDADVGRSMRESMVLEAQGAKFGLDVAENQSAITLSAKAWNDTHMFAEERAANMAATVDAISSLANAAMTFTMMGGPAGASEAGAADSTVAAMNTFPFG